MKRAPTSAGALAQSRRRQHPPSEVRALLPDPQHRQGYPPPARVLGDGEKAPGVMEVRKAW
jgi:hypothetical protein